MADGDKRYISKTGSVLTTGSVETVLLTERIDAETFGMFNITVVAQNLTSSYAMYSYQANLRTYVSGSVIDILSSGSSAVEFQTTSSAGPVGGASIGVSGSNNIQILVSGANDVSYEWGGMLSGYTTEITHQSGSHSVDQLLALNPVGWWNADAGDGVGIVHTTGTIESFVDLTGNGLNLIPSLQNNGLTGSASPTYMTGGTGPYGRDFIRFSGDGNYLRTPGDQGWTAQPFTIAMSVLPNRSGTVGRLVSITHNRPGTGRSISLFDVISGQFRMYAGGAGSLLNSSDINHWRVAVAVFSGTTSRSVITQAGSKEATNIGDGWQILLGAADIKADIILGDRAANGDGLESAGNTPMDVGEMWVWNEEIPNDTIFNVIIPYMNERWITGSTE